jgi:hypothetical protein
LTQTGQFSTVPNPAIDGVVLGIEQIVSSATAPPQRRQKSSGIAGYSSDGSIIANSEPGFFRAELLHHFVGL